jgi:hypothetical protein
MVCQSGRAASRTPRTLPILPAGAQATPRLRDRLVALFGHGPKRQRRVLVAVAGEGRLACVPDDLTRTSQSGVVYCPECAEREFKSSAFGSPPAL